MKQIIHAIIVSLLIYVCNPQLSFAHTIPTVTHNFRLQYTSEYIDFSVNYSFDRVIVHRYITTMDTNNDRTISEDEQKKWVDTYFPQIKVKINDKDYKVENTKVSFPTYASFLNENAGVSIEGKINTTLSCNDIAKIEVTDESAFLSLQDDIYKFEHVNKDCLELNEYENKVNHTIAKIGKKEGKVLASTTEKSGGLGWLSLTSNDNLSNIQTFLSDKTNNTKFMLLAIVIATIVGALHALTPGHGKTLIAAYLVGEKGTIKDALILASTTTLTHTMAIYLLGAVSLFATQYFLPEKIIPALETLSTLSILVLGITILVQRIREFKHKRNPDNHHNSQENSHDHSSLTHTHDGSTHSHDLSHLKDKKISLKALISLGFSGGIVPCPDALAIMIMSISLNKIIIGMILILFFSAGLAGVLVSLGIILVSSKTFFRKYTPSEKFAQYVPVISAVVITLAGVLLTLKVVL